MELLKVILDFIARIATPLAVCVALLIFRAELALILQILRGLLEKVGAGRLPLSFGNLTVGSLAKTAVEQIEKGDLDSAARTIQKLLSPAAPLALGYVDNFLKGFKMKDNGGFDFHVAGEKPGSNGAINSVFTIYIPRKLSDIDSSAKDLVRDKYPNEEIKSISIQSIEGRSFTGFAVMRENRLYPIDVPKTLTSIRHVFQFRAKQLKVGGMSSHEIERLENENLDEFEDVIRERTKELQEKHCIRVIRERSELFY